ncbi:hypothetical protein LY90DRAFT_663148 [Neocallimastix californiae]|uniref:Magnesium chelatase n=1 Tax=Neocallimastix californiae TaxID=1754190 RepID=A0A1Y2FRD5_9FUNG|nr:hypothetical protein LY90DRAFT_663148 [Neocallimastix californiae]|eukprot:ORY86499.1 hypothetical protein LY90DRAFT_663148 [Neocallimastix californiae]
MSTRIESIQASNNEINSISENKNKLNTNKITWLVQKLSELKYDPNKAVPFYFKDDVLVTILMCLICKKNSIIFDVNENQKPFKNMLEKIIFSIFGFSYSSFRCKPTTTVNEFISGILSKTKGKCEEHKEIIGNSVILQSEVSMNKTNSMPDLEVTPLETSNGQKLSSSIMDFEINSSRELMNNQLLNLKNNSNVLYSNPMIKNIYTQKIEMEKNSKLHKPEIIHKIVVSDENGNNKEIAFNTNTLSKLNLRNKNTDFSMLYSEDNEEYQKIKDSIIQLNDQPLPNVIIIENMDSASPIIQDAILQMLLKKKLFNNEFPKPFIIISLISKEDIQNNVISQLLNNTFLYHRIKDVIAHNVPIYLSNDSLITDDEIKSLIEATEKITSSKFIDIYLRNIMTGIRTHPLISSGIPVAATNDLILASKALSALFDQTYMTVDHIQIALKHVVTHRMYLAHRSIHASKKLKEQCKNIGAENILADILNKLSVK